MPIFSFRSIRRMLDELAPSLSPVRVRELEAKIRARKDQAVPAEWEIAVGFALSKVGKIVDPGDHRPGNPDYIFLPRDSAKQVVVEVTTLSDQNADAQNPVSDFTSQLGQISVKEGISPQLGVLNCDLGDIEVDGQIVIGVPDRRDIDAFFRAAEFKQFLSTIKAVPLVSHRYGFDARGSRSAITYVPGQRYTSGSYRSYKVARRLDDKAIFNRLKSKEKQLSKSGLNVPSIVVLCDNDSHLLNFQQRKGPDTYGLDEIVSAFLDGRPRRQVGPMILDPGMPKQGNRIGAVLTLTVHRPIGFMSTGRTRELRGRLIPASHGDGYLRSEDFLSIANQAIESLPVPVSESVNARRSYRWPAGFGGGEMSDFKVKISLLTLQKVLAGEIPYQEFLECHGMLATQITRLDKGGYMISNIEIDRQQDADDDWVTLSFDDLQPGRLFDPKTG